MKKPKTITLFGGSGFVGQATTQLLLAHGHRVRIPVRSMEAAQAFPAMGPSDRLVLFPSAPRSDAAVSAALAGSDIVINLIGSTRQHKAASFGMIHIEIAARLARLAHEQHVQKFIHFSILGADSTSPIEMLRTKGLGEAAVRTFFPGAVIFRPSLIFGPHDHTLQRIASLSRFMPFIPLFGGGKTRFQPVFVGDVAEAVRAACERPLWEGQTLALAGPQVISFRETVALTLKLTGRSRILVPLPLRLAYIKALFFERFSNPLWTRDQVDLLPVDFVVGKNEGRALDSLGLKPHTLEELWPNFIV